MEKDKNITPNSEEAGPRKKQKPGLNAVRPDDSIERSFKDMAANRGLSQTEMFERIFLSFITQERESKQQQAIDYTSEINLISNNLNNILNHFKGITKKAQETVLTISSNAEQTQKNLNFEVDTMKKKAEDLEKRNIELEEINKVFSDVKNSLEDTISKQNSELAEIKSILREKDIQIKDQDKAIRIMEKSSENLQKENDKLSEELRNNESKLKSLETSNNNLQATLFSIETFKKSEIAAIDTKYKSIISNLEDQIKNFNNTKEKELKTLENRVRIELDAEKKMAIADMKLKLADMKGKYAESQAHIEKLHVDYINQINSLQYQQK